MAHFSHLASVFPGECKDTYADKVKKSEFDGLGNVRPRPLHLQTPLLIPSQGLPFFMHLQS